MTKIVLDKSNNTIKPLLYIFISLLLALASYVTTIRNWDGSFPSGEFHLQIQNQTGTPIKGAKLNIYKGIIKQHAFGYPFGNYQAENSLISNEAGEIVITHHSLGFEFGGTRWYLFWIIPMGQRSPTFNCEITADGYETGKFSINQIFKPAYYGSNVPKKTIELSGIEGFSFPLTIGIYKLPVVLNEK